MRLPSLFAFLVAAIPFTAFPDTYKPLQFGPYMVHHITFGANPAGYRYALTNGYYRFKIGWIEPILENGGGILKDTYFETDGEANSSPFQSDVGTTFNMKPIRYLEVGLSYNRLIFHNSLVSFAAPGEDMIDLDRAQPGDLMKLDREFAGADVFTFQANFTFDIGPTQLFVMGSRALWDIDVPGKDFVYEYSNDLVIKPRDRVNNVLAKWSLDLTGFSKGPAYTFTGLAIRNQYWSTTRTDQEKNQISAGITGIRLGRNSERLRRGLDVSVGYWTRHPQLAGDDWAKNLSILLDWKLSVQFLKL